MFVGSDQISVPELPEAIEGFEVALRIMYEVEPGMPIGCVLTFIAVARNLQSLATGEINLSDIGKDIGMPYSSLLRYTDYLCEGAKNVKALDLMEKGISEHDKRARLIRLTPQGEDLVQRLAVALGNEPVLSRPGM